MFTERKHGVCTISSIPMRAEPDEKSEMVSMLLFGELYKVLDSKKGWCKVVTEYDGYYGWISDSVLFTISDEEYTIFSAQCKTLCRPVLILQPDYPEYPFMILPGSSLPPLLGRDFILGGKRFTITETQAICNESKNPTDRIRQTAMLFLNAPYLWGGRSLFGVDCSGFVQVVFKTAGIQLPRDASEQAKVGVPIAFHAAGEGDLAFFGPTASKITHTGIILAHGRLIHASGKVRIDGINEKGIFREETEKVTHCLQRIMRVI